LVNASDELDPLHVYEWLKQHDLSGNVNIGSAEAERRYRIFSEVNLGQIPGPSHNQCLQDLLEFESSFAINKNEFGCVSDPELAFKVILKNRQPVSSQPIRYAPPQRKWLKQYVNMTN
jgi:hypothetical protein